MGHITPSNPRGPNTTARPLVDLRDRASPRRSSAPAFKIYNARASRQGRRFAKRVAREVPDDPQAQADRVFRLAITRAPTPRERLQLATLIRDHSLEHACWALLNSSEFLYLP